jgi:hypothetical protein
MAMDWSQYAAGTPQATPPESVDVVSQSEAELRKTGYLANGKPAPSAMVVDMNTPPPGGKPATVDWSKYAAAPSSQSKVDPADADKYDFTNDPQGAQERLMGDLGAKGYARGIIRGATAPVTIPADVAVWGTNAVKKVLDPDSSTLGTDASDALGMIMDKMGLKKPEGAGGTASELAGGLIGGGLNPSFAKDINPGKWWSAANPTSPVNNSVLGDAVRQSLGVPSKPGDYGVTTEVMRAAQQAYQGALNIGRNATTIFQDNPRTIATSLASIAQDAGYEKDTLAELLKRPEVTKLFRIFQDGKATTEQLGNASSALGGAAASASDSILRNTLFKFRDYAEDAIKSSLSPQAAALYDQGLQKYKAYQQISNSGALNTTTGEVNPVKLLNSIKNDADWINGTNQSPLYQVLRHVENGQKAIDSMVDSVPGKIGYALRTAVKTIPGVAQSIVQRGIPETLRQVANHPGFLQSLGGNPDANTNNVPNSPGSNP